MPIWLRKFTFNKLNEWYKEQNKDSNSTSSTKKIHQPNIKRGYSAKASNK